MKVMKKYKTMVQIVLGIVDELLEKQFFPKLIQPFLKHHEVFYGEFNLVLRKILDDRKSQIPAWFTANFITYVRTWVVFPTLLLLAWEYTFWPALLVVLVDFGDFLDGVVARFWVDVRKEQQQQQQAAKTLDDTKKDMSAVELLPSLARQHRDATYGGFVDAVCDKAYIVPCWISLTRVAVSMEWKVFSMVAMATLFCLILAETASACIRFRAFFTSPGVAAPPTAAGFDFSTSAVKADHVGKAKQTFEMIGTALFILNWTRWLGLALLLLALPLAYESVRRKIKNRVIYVPYTASTTTPFSHATLHFWMQAKALGASQLIVGVNTTTTSENKDAMIANARSCSAVDQVLVHSSTIIDETFMDQHQIDYVLLLASAISTVPTSPELLKSQQVLVLGADGIVGPLTNETAAKKDE